MKGTTVTFGRRLRADTASSTARLAAGAGVKNPSGTGKHAQVHAVPHDNHRQIHNIRNDDHGVDMSFQAEVRNDESGAGMSFQTKGVPYRW